MKSLLRISASCFSVLLSLVAIAQEPDIYRWKDASGLTHYGTTPPAGVEAAPIGSRGTVSFISPPAWLSPEELTIRQQKDSERWQAMEEERRARRLHANSQSRRSGTGSSHWDDEEDRETYWEDDYPSVNRLPAQPRLGPRPGFTLGGRPGLSL